MKIAELFPFSVYLFPLHFRRCFVCIADRIAKPVKTTKFVLGPQCVRGHFSVVWKYSRTSMARTPLGPRNYVRDKGSSS